MHYYAAHNLNQGRKKKSNRIIILAYVCAFPLKSYSLNFLIAVGPIKHFTWSNT